MVKIKVMVIRYRGTPQAWQLPRGVPIPDAQFFFVGEEGDGFVDGVGFFLIYARGQNFGPLGHRSPAPGLVSFCIVPACFPARGEKG